ncbi:hypothetical protein [Paenibacillus sp. NFR01]|uniref:hypothetical protein n=1 Tax=Paenibacillus sp. NFR01 TaxID=1566279 RepID=UPI0008AF7109|nr:hypothetical protein [Paenibacillus sp. NFR01]SET48695.1 hypothetical protein SAMN03159358_1822 [Paenibacillus sp. NFR01]
MHQKWVRRGLAGMLLMSLAGCSAESEAPADSEIWDRGTGKSLDGGAYGPLSPVMSDVYDRSIPAEVYSLD